MKSNSAANLIVCILFTHLTVFAFGVALHHKVLHHAHAVPAPKVVVVAHPHAHAHAHPQSHAHHHLFAKSERSFWSNPTANIVSYGTRLHLTVNVTKLETECFNSTTFTLNKLDWTVKLCKASAVDDNRFEDGLDGYLVHSIGGLEEDWVSDALTLFQLAITNDKIDGKIVKKMNHEYSQETLEHRIELIDWTTLMANCVQDDQFTVDVEVFVGPKRNAVIDMTQMASDFRIIVDNVDEMGETTSDAMVLQGVVWLVDISIDDEKVAVFLRRSSDSDLGILLDVNEWTWNVTMSLTLLPVKGAKSLTAEFTHQYYLENTWGFPNFVSFANFTSHYVQNDKATFVVNLKVDPPQPLWKIDDEMDNLNKLF